MSETVHVIPVGFDYERLLHPISKGDLEADRIRLVDADRSGTDASVADFADRMLQELEYTFGTHFELEVTIDTISNVYDYRSAYRTAWSILTDEVRAGNSVWVNISSMPRTVAFAFASAANAYIVENPSERENLHTYYVSPQKYFGPEMLSELREEAEFLNRLAERVDDPEIGERRGEITNLINNIERSGFTRGASRMEDGKLYVEFPASPLPDLSDFEIEILRFLAEHGSMPSTSALAREFMKSKVDNPDPSEFESFRSRVQYNVDNLEDKGYIERHKRNNSFETELSVTGELWVETHSDEPSADNDPLVEA